MKRIVVCCDGTRGKYDAEDKNTNIVRLFERLGQDGPDQISYYDPGVGTHSPLRNGTIGLLDKMVASVSGMGITSEGLNDNVREAYRYLMACYEPADQVYLFGYSRGAHTVRVLAGILHKCGLLTKGSENLLPYMTAIYRGKGNDHIAAGFKRRFLPGVQASLHRRVGHRSLNWVGEAKTVFQQPSEPRRCPWIPGIGPERKTLPLPCLPMGRDRPAR